MGKFKKVNEKRVVEAVNLAPLSGMFRGLFENLAERAPSVMSRIFNPEIERIGVGLADSGVERMVSPSALDSLVGPESLSTVLRRGRGGSDTKMLSYLAEDGKNSGAVQKMINNYYRNTPGQPRKVPTDNILKQLTSPQESIGDKSPFAATGRALGNAISKFKPELHETIMQSPIMLRDGAGLVNLREFLANPHNYNINWAEPGNQALLQQIRDYNAAKVQSLMIEEVTGNTGKIGAGAGTVGVGAGIGAGAVALGNAISNGVSTLSDGIKDSFTRNPAYPNIPQGASGPIKPFRNMPANTTPVIVDTSSIEGS